MNKLLTFYSETHKEMYENYFYPSFNKFLSKKYNLIENIIPQICRTGEFASHGFDEAMFKKIELIIENIDISDKNILVFSDCDIQFFSDLEFDLQSFDILFQEDYKGMKCAGFFICKQTKKVLDFFNLVKEEFIKIKDGKIDDQGIINRLLLKNEFGLNWQFLPTDKYWSVGNATEGKVWNGEKINIPNNLIMHHANYTVGIKNKINLLNLIKNYYETKN